MASPEAKTRAYDVVQVQLPIFRKRQVFLNEELAGRVAPSGMVISDIYCTQSHGTYVAVGCGVEVGKRVFVGRGVLEARSVAVASGVCAIWVKMVLTVAKTAWVS